jgi:acyl transferase domain-containing protein
MHCLPFACAQSQAFVMPLSFQKQWCICASCSRPGADVFGGVPVRFGSFLAGIEQFDAAAFAISEAEAVLMDPQQRLLLETVGELLLSQAGRPGMEPTARRAVGVYVGLSTVDYLKVRRESCGLLLTSPPIAWCIHSLFLPHRL